MSIGFKVLILCFILLAQTTLLCAQVPTRSLDYFLQEATKYNPTIKDFNNQQQALKIDSLLLLASRKPQVTGNVAGLYAPIVNGYGFDEVMTNGQSLEALLNINYELLNNKRMANQLQAINLQRDSIKYAGTLSVYDLNKSITEQYITVYASQQEVAFNLEIEALLKQEETLLKQLTRNNVYKQSEYLTFLVSLKQQELTLKQAENQYKNDYATLNYLVGITDTILIQLAEPQLNTNNTLFGGNFFTRRFDIDSLKNVNQRTAIDLNYRPKLGVYANGGYSSSFTLQPYKNFGASVGLTLSVPIYDGHQKKMQYDKLVLTSLTAGYYKDFFIRQQHQQLTMISNQILASNELFGKINEQIKLAKGLMDVDLKLMPTGDVKVTDFIIAINNYMAIENVRRQTNINRLRLINQFNYWNR